MLRYALVAEAMFITLIASGGVIMGWGPLHDLLRSENFDEDRLEKVFNIGFIGLSVGSVVFGLALDVIGPRLASIAGLIISCGGNLLMAFTDQLEMAFFLIGAGGNGPYLSSMNFGNLFKHPGTVISFIAALFNTAGFTYELLTVIPHVTRQSFFIGYAFVTIGVLVLVALTYPNKAFSHGDEATLPGLSFRQSKDSDGSMTTEALLGDDSHDKLATSPPPASDHLPSDHLGGDGCGGNTHAPGMSYWQNQWRLMKLSMTPAHHWNLIFYGVSLFIMSFVGGCMPDLLSRKGDTGVYTNYILIFVGNGLPTFLNPIVGVLLARYGFGLVFLLCNISNQAVLLMTFLNLQAQAGTIVLIAAQKALLITPWLSFLALNFDMNVYGSLVALSTAAAAIIGIGTIPLSSVTSAGHYFWPMMGLAIVCTPLYGFPLYLFFGRGARKDKKHALGYDKSSKDDMLDTSQHDVYIGVDGVSVNSPA